jgi:hypothetical protein
MIKVTSVEHRGDYRLALRFSDGSDGEADLRDHLGHRAFAPVRDVARFSEAFVAHGTVCWPGELDLAPERLYALANGLPIPDSFEAADANEREVSLRELRKLAGKTQDRVSEAMSIDQAELSRLERRGDCKVSTLRRFVEALGGQLEIAAVVNGKRVTLRGV